VQFRKITIVGVGLLGGSIGLAAKKRRVAGEIAGFVRSKKSISDCEKSGATDFATTDLLAAKCFRSQNNFCPRSNAARLSPTLAA
jgi:prephenate dehydrogenase